MWKWLFLSGLLVVLPMRAVADVSVPDTPAGRALGMWLGAFNGGDTTHAYVDTKWRAQVGGYDLLEIYSNDATSIFFRLKPKQPLDDAARTKLVERVAAIFNDLYVYPETGKKISDALRKRRTRGEYRGIDDAEDFAKKLSSDLRDVSHDKHAEVHFSYLVQPPQAPNDSKWLAAINCGFKRAEHLPGNIGYLKFDLFADPQMCAETAAAAMNFVADSDAVIIDLRDNHGGSGAMVEFIASYLFSERTHLNDIYRRPENATTQSWTLSYVPGRKFIENPVLVLTSKQTFSAAEDFSDVLKSRKRATLVGDATGGGAHPVDAKPVDAHFIAIVPTGRSIDPITGRDWEGVGVQPDVKVDAAQALEVATELATRGH